MNILIMDDDEYIVESIKTIVDWERLKIDGVFSAVSLVQAKEIFRTVPLQIMLCDIEMRSESGLEFVEWVREQGSLAQVIFLTGYAEFSYAQQAIRLRSQEYLLKPIQYLRLEEVLERTVKKVKEDDQSRLELEKWENSFAFRKEGFWKQILADRAGENEEEIMEHVHSLGMPYRKEDRFVILFIEIFDYQTILEKLERGMYDFIIQNITNELMGTEGFLAEVVFRTDEEEASRWNVVLKINQEISQKECRQRLERISRDYIWKIKQNLKSLVGCYAGNPRSVWEIPREAKKMRIMVRDDVLGAGNVRFLEEYSTDRTPYCRPEFSQWEEYLLEREDKCLECCVKQYLSHMERSEEANISSLECFEADFHQMIFSVLKEKNISVSLLSEQVNLKASEGALKSVRHMKKYVLQLLSLTWKYMDLAVQDQSVIKITKDYIGEHYAEELTREDLARQVYLSPDYLSRLFRSEVGENLSSYLIRYRIEKAKELLRGTKEPVNQIASAVGYTNFSYFAKIFRKYTGCTPNVYRKGEKSFGETEVRE